MMKIRPLLQHRTPYYYFSLFPKAEGRVEAAEVITLIILHNVKQKKQHVSTQSSKATTVQLQHISVSLQHNQWTVTTPVSPHNTITTQSHTGTTQPHQSHHTFTTQLPSNIAQSQHLRKVATTLSQHCHNAGITQQHHNTATIQEQQCMATIQPLHSPLTAT